MIAAVMTMGPVRSLTVHQIAYMESVGVERAAAANVVGLAGLLTSGILHWAWAGCRIASGALTAYTIGACWLFGAVGMLVAAAARLTRALAAVCCTRCFSPWAKARAAARRRPWRAMSSSVRAWALSTAWWAGWAAWARRFGPWLVGRLRDESGSYDGGLLLVVAMVAPCSLITYSFVARFAANG